MLNIVIKSSAYQKLMAFNDDDDDDDNNNNNKTRRKSLHTVQRRYIARFKHTLAVDVRCYLLIYCQYMYWMFLSCQTP